MSNKNAAKLNAILDYDGRPPVFMEIAKGKVHESKKANTFNFSKDSVVVMDRGYLDFNWMNIWMNILYSNSRFFVTRSKENMNYLVAVRVSRRLRVGSLRIRSSP
ncbi:transposase [Sphingobacterium puteale]|uniref:transposase n=1 Tax=Sphingobacterium puteale TaxID=2420510 RepID=UPI003D997CDA